MSDLSRSLPEAAWAEMKAPPYSDWEYSYLPPKAKARVDRTVAAVLETLIPELEALPADGSAIDELTDRWRQAAAEVRKGQ